MRNAAAVEIRVHEREMIVLPSSKGINRRKTAAQISTKVRAELGHSQEASVKEVIFDLGQVTWISSAALNELIRLQAEFRSLGVLLRLRSLHETVREVLRMTRLERIFEVDEPSVVEIATVFSALDSEPTEAASRGTPVSV